MPAVSRVKGQFRKVTKEELLFWGELGVAPATWDILNSMQPPPLRCRWLWVQHEADSFKDSAAQNHWSEGNMQDRQSLEVPKPLNVFRAEKAVHDSV